jgi:hypothetical protein
MSTDLVKLIEKVQMNFGEGSFEITNHHLSEVIANGKKINVIYNEGDLTKNYVKYATDLLSGVYGQEFIEDIISGFGETLKTNINSFKGSYRNKQSVIKEILPSVFIHTSMSKVLMESLIVTLTSKARLHIKFYDRIVNEKKLDEKTIITFASKYKNISEFSKSEPDVYRATVRMGLKETISELYKKKTSKGREIKRGRL